VITFYLVCKNAKHEDHGEETVEKFELNTDYYEGLKMLRCIVNIFKGFMQQSILMGRIKE